MDELNLKTEETEVIGELELFKVPKYDLKKLKKRTISSTIFVGIVLFTMLFPKYNDFDVIFKAIYARNYVGFDVMENIGSVIFIIAFLIAVIFTIFNLIYLYSESEWPSIINPKKLFDFYDVFTIVPLFIMIVTVLNAFVISPATISRTSMEPNYYEGNSVFVYHLFEKYERYDVVIVFIAENDYYIKRVIGLPGETIKLQDGDIYINGVLLDDPTILKPGAHTYCNVGSLADETEICEWVIPEGSYFVMGDNREASIDSRLLGTFTEDKFYGKVILKTN